MTAADVVSPDFWGDFWVGPARIAGVLLGALVIRWLLHRAIDGLVGRVAAWTPHQRLTSGPGRVLVEAGVLLAERRRQRVQTLGSALRSLASFLVFGVAAATVLGELGVNLAPLVASAGIVGAAVAFGAQSLVRDVLTGAFLIVEDQYGVGDSIDLGTVAGDVEVVGLRVTQLRDADGVVWYVRNGEILRVGNRSQGWGTALVDVPVPAGAALDATRAAVDRAAAELAANPAWAGRLVLAPEPAVVEELTVDSVTLRVSLRCTPGEHVAVQRELRARIWVALEPLRPGPDTG